MPPADRSPDHRALILFGPVLGALFAYLAYSRSPWTMPAVMLAIAIVGVALARREAGVGVALVLIPIGSIISRVFGLVDWDPYMPALVWACLLAAGTLLAAWTGRWRRPPMAFAVLAYAAVALFAVVVGGDLSAGAQPIRFVFVGSLLFFATAMLVRERPDLRWILRSAAGAVGVVAGVAALQSVGGGSGGAFETSTGEFVDRVSGGFSHPNVLGGYLAFLMPLLVAGLLLDKPWRYIYLAAGALGVGAVYLSFSRGALVGLAIVPLFFLPPRRALWSLPIVGALVLLVAPDLLRERFSALGGEGSELATRQDFWRASLSIWADHPLLGVGLGGFPDAYAAADVPGRLFLPTTIVQPPPHAHNLFLNSLAETGVLGLAAITLLVALALRQALALRRLADPWFRTMGSALLAMGAVFLLHNQFEVTIFGELGETFWIFLGLVSAVGGIAAREAHRSQSSKGGVRPGFR